MRDGDRPYQIGQGVMPLHYAAMFGSVEGVQRLLEYGAFVKFDGMFTHTDTHTYTLDSLLRIQDYRGYAPIEYAMENGHIDVIDHFLQKCLVLRNLNLDEWRSVSRPGNMHGSNAYDLGMDTTPLHYAAIFGSVEGVQRLFEHGAYYCGVMLSYTTDSLLSLKDVRFCTPIDYAVMYGRADVAHLFFERCRTDNRTQQMANIALAAAIRCNKIEMVKLLVEEYDADIKKVDCWRNFPGYFHDRGEMAKLLIVNYGVDPNNHLPDIKGNLTLPSVDNHSLSYVLAHDPIVNPMSDQIFQFASGSTPFEQESIIRKTMIYAALGDREGYRLFSEDDMLFSGKILKNFPEYDHQKLSSRLISSQRAIGGDEIKSLLAPSQHNERTTLEDAEKDIENVYGEGEGHAQTTSVVAEGGPPVMSRIPSASDFLAGKGFARGVVDGERAATRTEGGLPAMSTIPPISSSLTGNGPAHVVESDLVGALATQSVRNGAESVTSVGTDDALPSEGLSPRGAEERSIVSSESGGDATDLMSTPETSHVAQQKKRRQRCNVFKGCFVRWR